MVAPRRQEATADAGSVDASYGAASGNAANRYAFFLFLVILQILNGMVEAMDSSQAAANPYLPAGDGAPGLSSRLSDGDNSFLDGSSNSQVLDRSQSGVSQFQSVNRGGTTQGSIGSGGGAVGPSGLASHQTSGVTPDRTFGQRGSGSAVGFATSWRWHDPKVSDVSRIVSGGFRCNQRYKRKADFGVGDREQGKWGKQSSAEGNDSTPAIGSNKRKRYTGDMTRVAKREINKRNTRDKKRYYWRKRVIGRSRA